MDSLALQLAIKYATKSGKLTLAQKITDELLEDKPRQIERRSSPVRPIILPAHQPMFEAPRPVKVVANAPPFANPFRKKAREDLPPHSSTTDELSQWKPSIGKTRLSSTKVLPQVREKSSSSSSDNSSLICFSRRSIWKTINRRWLEREKSSTSRTTTMRRMIKRLVKTNETN